MQYDQEGKRVEKVTEAGELIAHVGGLSGRIKGI